MAPAGPGTITTSVWAREEAFVRKINDPMPGTSPSATALQRPSAAGLAGVRPPSRVESKMGWEKPAIADAVRVTGPTGQRLQTNPAFSEIFHDNRNTLAEKPTIGELSYATLAEKTSAITINCSVIRVKELLTAILKKEISKIFINTGPSTCPHLL